jgi:membrane protease YdiL (CAAX protease family)
MKQFLLKHPVLSVIALAMCWLVLLLVFAGIVTGLFKTEIGSSTYMFVAHIAMFICMLILLWRLGWLKSAGIARPGKSGIWLIAVVATVYSALTALYSFYGKFSFDLSSLKNLPSALDIIRSQIAVCLDEETFFRGIILYFLILYPVGRKRGKMGSVIVMSVIFGLMHVLWVVFSGLSGLSALFLALQAMIISVWWASLVLAGGSIWPAFLAHFVVNTVIALQGTSHSIVQPEHMAYGAVLLFSLPLGVIAFLLIRRSSSNKFQPAD